MRSRVWRTLASTSALAIVLSACPAPDPHVDLGMSDSTFVRTVVRLRRIALDSSMDSISRDSARRMVLRDERVTSTLLDSAARILRFEPKRADTLWKTIEAQVTRRQAPSH
jgi:hypothetical protein